jgi:hypothetical protein
MLLAIKLAVKMELLVNISGKHIFQIMKKLLISII